MAAVSSPARHHAARSAMAVKDQAEKGATFEDSAALFESMLIAAANSIGEAAQEIAAELDKIEDRVLSDAQSDESAALLRLRLRRGISRQERLVKAAHSVRPNSNRAGERKSFRRIAI
jgi:Mg2+ and Co2+ transporter CorA